MRSNKIWLCLSRALALGCGVGPNACGITILSLEPHAEKQIPDEAYAIDCELNRLESLTVRSHLHTQTQF